MKRRLVASMLFLSCFLTVGAEEAKSWVGRIGTPQYFAVSVADVDEAAGWYAAVFGLRKLDDTSAEDGRWRIVNLSNDDLFVEIIRDRRDQAVERARGFAKVGFRVPNLDAIADRVAKETGDRPRIVSFEKHGVRILQLKDPEGNTIQLTATLPSTPAD